MDLELVFQLLVLLQFMIQCVLKHCAQTCMVHAGNFGWKLLVAILDTPYKYVY